MLATLIIEINRRWTRVIDDPSGHVKTLHPRVVLRGEAQIKRDSFTMAGTMTALYTNRSERV